MVFAARELPFALEHTARQASMTKWEVLTETTATCSFEALAVLYKVLLLSSKRTLGSGSPWAPAGMKSMKYAKMQVATNNV